MASPRDCARELLDVIPLVMWSVRPGVRANVQRHLSMPQFGALMYLRRHEGASLSDVAGHMGLTLPSASKLIDGLVVRGLVTRETRSDDRRRVALGIAPDGRDTIRAVREATVAELSERLAAMPAADRAAVVGAMRMLRAAFAPERPGQLVRSLGGSR